MAGAMVFAKAGVAATKEGIKQYFESESKKLQFKQQAQQYEAQAKLQELQAKQSQQQMYNTYRSGAWSAMQQGLIDRAKLGQIKASQSGSGVLMGSGSAKDVVNSQKMTAELNQIALQQNTTSAANQSRIQTANYLAGAEINRGNAAAARTMSSSINTLANMISGAAIAFGDSLLGSGQFDSYMPGSSN